MQCRGTFLIYLNQDDTIVDWFIVHASHPYVTGYACCEDFVLVFITVSHFLQHLEECLKYFFFIYILFNEFKFLCHIILWTILCCDAFYHSVYHVCFIAIVKHLEMLSLCVKRNISAIYYYSYLVVTPIWDVVCSIHDR